MCPMKPKDSPFPVLGHVHLGTHPHGPHAGSTAWKQQEHQSSVGGGNAKLLIAGGSQGAIHTSFPPSHPALP